MYHYCHILFFLYSVLWVSFILAFASWYSSLNFILKIAMRIEHVYKLGGYWVWVRL